MADTVGMQNPLLVVGGDGSALWQGAGFSTGRPVIGVPTNAAIAEGDAVVIDPAGLRIQASNLASTAASVAQVLGVRSAITTGNFDRGFVGVALEAAVLTTANAPTSVKIAGIGWIVGVKVASATGTVGHYAVATSTAGTVSSTATLPTVPVGYLGKVVKPSGTTGGVTDTGTATRMGVLVNPS